MIKIAIQGHKTKGKEVIQILESLGGKNCGNVNGNCDHYYFINNNGDIDVDCKKRLFTYKLYTLEEFKQQFPFKVGDKVIINNGSIGVVKKLIPEHISAYCVKTNNINYWCTPLSLRFYKKMKEKRNITLNLEKAKEWYNKGGELKEVALQAYSEEELSKIDLPKTWEEFCEKFPVKKSECWLGAQGTIYPTTIDTINRKYKNWIPSKKSAEAHLALIQLEQLRDCYRQGDIPDFTNKDCKYCIVKDRDNIHVAHTYHINYFLSFTKKEVAEEYLANFKPLIKIAEDYI